MILVAVIALGTAWLHIQREIDGWKVVAVACSTFVDLLHALCF